jgi:hypothetical protein
MKHRMLIRGALVSVVSSMLWCGVMTGHAAASTVRARPMCGQTSCVHAMLTIINADRAAHRLAPLRLQRAQADGKSGCPGSYGHSVAMAASGSIWHVNARFPAASFPHNLCVQYRSAGENVGMSASGNVDSDLHELDQLMMQEPHASSVCAREANHACNILSPVFHFVGIGVYVSGNTTWLTEDFTN